jgi:glyoxylate reductase
MRVVFWDREGTRKPVDFGYDIAERLPLDALLKISNVLSLNCPLTEQTKNLLSRERLELLPSGAIIVNAARGNIVDEMAVMDLLDNGHLGGAGFDVFDTEPALNPRWSKTPRTVLLPHLGSATSETRSAMAQMVCDGIARILMNG